MVRQHHATRADANVLRDRGDLPDHHVGRRARDGRKIVMLGEPVADIAEPVDMARQIDAVAQRGGRRRGGGDDGEVEDGERYHGPKLMHGSGPTMGAVGRAGLTGTRKKANTAGGIHGRNISYECQFPTPSEVREERTKRAITSVKTYA